MQEHIERLNRHIEQGTLIRGAWRGRDANGRETACLLAAMVPKCGEEENTSECPRAAEWAATAARAAEAAHRVAWDHLTASLFDAIEREFA